MEYQRDILLNAIIIIENLKTGEAKTGFELFEDLKYKVWAQDGFVLEHHSPDNPAQFKELLNTIKKRCREQGLYPWIHLEIHGHWKGLVFGDAEENLDWAEVRETLIEINITTKFNLFLSLAVCYGAFILPSILNIETAAPYMGIFASEKIEYPSNILKVFSNFYDEFFTSWNLRKAESRVKRAVPNTNFKAYQSEVLFLESYVLYMRKALTPYSMIQRWRIHVLSGKIRGNAKAKRKKRAEYFKGLNDRDINSKQFIEMRNRFFNIGPEYIGPFTQISHDHLAAFSKKLKKKKRRP